MAVLNEQQKRRFRECTSIKVRECELPDDAIAETVVFYDPRDDVYCNVDQARDDGVPWLYFTQRTRMATLDGSVENMIDSVLEEYHEEAREELTTAAVDELKAFVNAWWERNEPESYTPDYRKVLYLCCDLVSLYSRHECPTCGKDLATLACDEDCDFIDTACLMYGDNAIE